MPVTHGLVGSPTDGADVVRGLVADPISPFLARFIDCVRITFRAFAAVSMKVRSFPAVRRGG